MWDDYERLFYPSLYGDVIADPKPVMAEVATSTVQKARDLVALRRATWERNADMMVRAAWEMAQRFYRGGKLLAFGNGGSATDAQDIVADFMAPPVAGRRSLPALALTNDVAIVTAVGNDVGFDNIFLRQVIAYGRPIDIALGISTSGNSENVLKALEQAHKQGLLTVAVLGYDGGTIGRSPAVDYAIVVPSSYVPRIQEAQATVLHALWGMVHTALDILEGRLGDEVCR